MRFSLLLRLGIQTDLDATAEIHRFCFRSYEWIVGGDTASRFDGIAHGALLSRARRRIEDKDFLGLVRSFRKARVLSQRGTRQEPTSGTPQGGIPSPPMVNIAPSVLDAHLIKLSRYADDFVVLVAGTKSHAEDFLGKVANILVPKGLRLSGVKTGMTHISRGFDFFGFRLQKRTTPGKTAERIHSWPSTKALV